MAVATTTAEEELIPLASGRSDCSSTRQGARSPKLARSRATTLRG